MAAQVKKCSTCEYSTWTKERYLCNACDGHSNWAPMAHKPPQVSINIPLIALSGLAGSGKSTAADFLVLEHGYTRVKFADPLKEMLRAYYRCLGIPLGDIEARLEGDAKEIPDRLLGGKSPRHAMQTLGTEWGRDQISQRLWVMAWIERASALLGEHKKIVVDDLRFPNEKAAVSLLGGIHLHITRGGESTPAGHISEGGVDNPDKTITNDRSVKDLHQAMISALTA